MEKMTYSKNILWDSFENFARNCNYQIRKKGMNERDFILSIPRYLMRLLDIIRVENYLMVTTNDNGPISDGTLMFGIRIQTGYEKKYVCFHKDYPAIREEGFYFEAELPQTVMV